MGSSNRGMTGSRHAPSAVFRLLLLCLFPDLTADDLSPLVTNHFIYGKLDEKVKVYVKVLRNSPFLACMDEEIAQKEIIDPYYLWVGPDGRNLKGHANVNLTETGKLMVKSFDRSMSGTYSCTLTYSSISNDIRMEKKKFRSYEFLMFAYRDPDYVFEINTRFTAMQCHQAANRVFYEELISRIEALVKYLTCHLTDKFYKCHVLKIPEHGLQNQLFITFTVSPFGSGWENMCLNIVYDCEDETNKRVKKARELIEQFFLTLPYVLKETFENVPKINYIEHSLDVTRIDSCRPGFGKNDITHSDCSSCCVVCDPGTYSSNNAAECETCKDIKITTYGASAC